MRRTKKEKKKKKKKKTRKKAKRRNENDHKKHVMLSTKRTPKFAARVRNSTTDWPACTSIMVFWCQKRQPISAKYGKT